MQEVQVAPSSDGELICPACGGGFVEEMTEPAPGVQAGGPAQQPPNPMAPPFATGLNPFDPGPAVFRLGYDSGPGGGTFRVQTNGTGFGPGDNPIDIISQMLAGMGAPPNMGRGQAGQPQIVPSPLQAILGLLGGNIQVVVDDGTGNRVPGQMGDYHWGNMEQLLEQLAAQVCLPSKPCNAVLVGLVSHARLSNPFHMCWRPCRRCRAGTHRDLILLTDMLCISASSLVLSFETYSSVDNCLKYT